MKHLLSNELNLVSDIELTQVSAGYLLLQPGTSGLVLTPKPMPAPIEPIVYITQSTKETGGDAFAI